jgi:hypothetical protein
MINNIEMDFFASSNDYLSSTGIGPCIAFIVLLAKDQTIFMEHRSHLFLPVGSKMSIQNVSLCLNNISEHVHATLPDESNIR